ncbi:spore germination protein GerPE [Bacillus sp. Marseille-Q3570]|uniref:spore germination protein GerPE n=1 Tax=Bacillus sp. Marseille-Q3570 TaxID=2963522 RepID=UPI0021B7B8A2|nr:spore germination protein GerPE [Bacillus sp. Marseille-Q3570]
MDRISVVQYIEIVSVTTSSIVQAGDTTILTPVSRALAVQRQESTYDEEEHQFDMYPIFSIPFPPLYYETIPVKTVQENPAIHVNSINIIGVAASSAVRIGKTDFVSSEARVKHIRQFTVNPYE